MANKLIKLFLIVFLPVFAIGCADNRTELQKIIDSGVLRFATIEKPNNYLPVSGYDKGFEYELAQKYSEYLGIKLKILVADDVNEIVSMIRLGKAMIGASAFLNEYEIDNQLEFGPEYYKVTQQVIYRNGSRRPANIEDIEDGELVISNKKQVEDLLLEIEQKNPRFSWQKESDKNTLDLLKQLDQEKIQATVANSNTISLYKHLFPDLKVAFDLTDPKSVSWIYKYNPDQSLQKSISAFFNLIKDNGELDKLVERYFNHFHKFNYVDARTFLERIELRLPEYETYFKNTAKITNIDWLLLAAISYQESHWDPVAKSPTGVRGLMMLTEDTAQHVGIEDRLDPEQSIHGGAKYFSLTYEKIPKRINEPDRTWLALAAYNIGLAHLEDARILTEKRGGDPDKWIDVKATLPLLSQQEWYEQTRFGKARGDEPVRYVENIRRYYDVLRWIKYINEDKHQNRLQIQALAIDSPAL